MDEINILVPELPESITHATVIKWYKKVNDNVKQDEILADIETEKVILEVPSIYDGILKLILKKEGNKVISKEIIGVIKKKNNNNNIKKNNIKNNICVSKNQNYKKIDYKISKDKENHLSPSIRRNILKNKKSKYLENKKNKNLNTELRSKKIIPISPIRARITERLLRTKNNTVMLTTFNEVNMQSIIKIRNSYNDEFKKIHGIKLGFMSFFVKIITQSLKSFPDINAKIEKKNIIYYDYFDINIAISTKIGLVTPILKNADLMTMSEIEKKIKYFALKGNDGKLELSDLIGGTFTITNGGVFGSLMSTPVINPPQVAILGIHAIKDRPVAINNKVKILPMMYLALSYDHRLIDGKQAVGFLNMVKNKIEDFSRFLLDI